jgi:putative DNA primase/helicase
VNVEAVPPELRARRQWVVWRYERRDGKPTKVPYNPTTGQRASSTDPQTWADYDLAAGMARQPGVDGVGFVFAAGDPYCGLDLDRCIADGDLHPDAAAIVRRLATYSERSVSGTGAHAIGRADLNGFKRNRTGNTPWGGEFEVYDRGRFFVMTGERFPGSPEPTDIQAELEPLLAELFPTSVANGRPAPEIRPSTRTDGEVLERAFAASNGGNVQALYRGDVAGYGSRSEADLALCSMLAFWTGPDPGQLDRLFRGSGLMRD